MKTEISRAKAALDQVSLPGALKDRAEQRVVQFCERHSLRGEWLANVLADDNRFAAQLALVFATSAFVADACLAAPDMLADLVDSGDLNTAYTETSLAERLRKALEGANDEKDLQRILRHFRRREMVRIVWRDFTRMALLLETTGDVTRLAEACIQQSLDFLHPVVAAQLGTPIGKVSGQPQHMVVLGMGKMGAWELNVSSDIDLIFTFPESGQTAGGRRQVSNQEFFIRLSQKLIQALDIHTVDGFVFRVDMRLRPYGESGAMVLNFDAMEEYYQTQGRDWERYAMIKARVVAGDPAAGESLMTILRPFTYRKYIDFSAIQSLRDMKSLINREVARLGIVDDVKKGAGGIREVEFIAQAFQLIRGGKDKRFQNPSLKHVLGVLAEDSLLPEGEPERLWQAYEFLRNVEHVLQGVADKQTQQLPQSEDERRDVALLMGFADWESFYSQLESHRSAVQAIFAGIAAETASEQKPSEEVSAARLLWLGAGDVETVATELQGMGYSEPQPLASALLTLRESRAVKAMTATVRDRLDTFMPQLLTFCAGQANSDQSLARILGLVEGILRRSAYLVLMIENPDALRQLVYLCGESRWIAEQISRYPALLDELLDPRTLYTAQDRDSIRGELRQYLLRIPSEDLEAQMEALRYFRRAQALRIAACEVSGTLALMKVSDNLTWLAEVIVEQVLTLAWDWMVAKHGAPGRPEGAPEPGLLVLGYGKLGGLELGHSSDLDLVFLHNANPNLFSDGTKSIDNNTFFMRLCQRMIHILSTQTPSGNLYEVDARLRPNGNSGLLVTSVAAFEKYQREDAWTWEHQALVRARPVAGDAGIAETFSAIREGVLCLSREREKLIRDVVEMREKMRVHLGSASTREENSASRFHIKQDAGGIVDIEFLVQYHVLFYADRHPGLTEFTDNMRILDCIRDLGLLEQGQVACLQDAFVFYRTLGHRQSLQGQSSVIDSGPELPYREAVTAIWNQVMGG